MAPVLQSMQFHTAPSLIPFWTIVVADKETKAFVKKQAPTVDVFVDRDVAALVAVGARRQAAASSRSC